MIRYRFPLDGGEVDNPFKLGKHYGFDMVRSFPDVTLGFPIHAVSSGVVGRHGSGTIMGYDYGNWLEILMDDGVWVFTAHMQHPATLQQGQRVTIGQQIGLAGATGKVTGPHVHTAFMRGSLDKASSFDGVPYISARISAQPSGSGGTVVPVPEGDSMPRVIHTQDNPTLPFQGVATGTVTRLDADGATFYTGSQLSIAMAEAKAYNPGGALLEMTGDETVVLIQQSNAHKIQPGTGAGAPVDLTPLENSITALGVAVAKIPTTNPTTLHISAIEGELQ